VNWLFVLALPYDKMRFFPILLVVFYSHHFCAFSARKNIILDIQKHAHKSFLRLSMDGVLIICSSVLSILFFPLSPLVVNSFCLVLSHLHLATTEPWLAFVQKIFLTKTTSLFFLENNYFGKSCNCENRQ
jgi:hypothetical protein